jgi:hypothetical protein
MKKLLALVLVVLSLTGCLPPRKHHDVKDATVRLELVGLGTCSGTVIGPHAILSATHCFTEHAPVKVNGVMVLIEREINDGADHTILIVDETFDYWASRGAQPSQGDTVQLWGNPDGKTDWYRRGYMVGVDTDEEGRQVRVYDVNGFFGDSGSGLFDADGRLIAVTSLCVFDSAEGVPFKMMGSYDLNFTAQDWAQAAM